MGNFNASFKLNKNSTFKDINDEDISVSGSWSVKLNRTYRNPERNERVGSSPNSHHQKGRAFDMGIEGYSSEVPRGEAGVLMKAKKAFIVWKILMQNKPPGADMI